jgi:glutamine synthetase
MSAKLELLLRSAFVTLIIALITFTTFGHGRTDREQLLQLHKRILQNHLDGDLDDWLRFESEEYVLANRGEVSFPGKRERASAIGPYFKRSKFKAYRDLIEPIIRVSRDGTLGWVIVQVEAEGVSRKEDGAQEPIHFVSAWIELYEKKDGRWLRIGNVSNFK